jgi:hypothetical protein
VRPADLASLAMTRDAAPESQRSQREQETLAALLGTNELVGIAQRELIVSLLLDSESLAAVPVGRWVNVSNAADALDAAILSALRSASARTASHAETIASSARSQVKERLDEALGDARIEKSTPRPPGPTTATSPAPPTSDAQRSDRAPCRLTVVPDDEDGESNLPRGQDEGP